MTFINNDFLLRSEMARRLYHSHAAAEPILDFHSHLPAAEIAEDRRYRNVTELWLEGDHYKWRLMRANGIDERYCTGDAPPYEKFQAWARTVPATVRNPLYHWTHLELKRYFGIDDLLNECTAKSIWERANALLAAPEFSARGILRKFGVRVVCTSDDPCDDLVAHAKINSDQNDFRVFPTFRPDKALQVHRPEQFNSWVGRLEQTGNIEIGSFSNFLDALKRRHDFFHARGARLSDHGLQYCHAAPCSRRDAEAIFAKARAGVAASPQEHEHFASYLMLFFGQLDATRGWTKQLHVGALRDVRSRKLDELGPDTGFDCMGDFRQAELFCRYLDLLDRENSLPKIIVYNINPSDTYALAAAIGSFQDAPVRAKIQLGSAWWFLDQKDGIESQLNALSNTGLLARFVGMVTDSRSFLSFPRHEYFRRILCDLLGRDVERGEVPDDERLLSAMVRDICYANAKDYLGLESPSPR
ncbi:MAG TPA: glucuronate isomerase [Candidatus Acidoferrales bacterium]|nr:glucuronate isomerase [Candidatus Acidoferrales bacterium]